MDNHTPDVAMHTQTKWLMGIVGSLVVLAIGAFFARTSTTLDRLVTDVAVIKALGEASAAENLPARVTSLEGLVTRVAAQVATMETNRWTRQDHQAFERLLEARFSRNESNIKNVLDALKVATPADVLAEVRHLRSELAESRKGKDQ